MIWIQLLLAAVLLQASASVGDFFTRLTRTSEWKLVRTVPVAFKTYHPQGMVRIGDAFIVSSVDRAGRGHLFKIDSNGKLLADVTIGEGAMYHPGGIDYDGTHVWVPVAEYRPSSRSIIYRVDPGTMKATEVFRVDDHIGAIVHNTDENTLQGVNWGSREFYYWEMDGGKPMRTRNPSHYVDYQDCKFVGRRRMLCSGVTELGGPPGAKPFRLGGLDLIDLRVPYPIHQVPVLLWTKSGVAMTQNPVWLEPTDTGLRAYFMPEDDVSTIYVYEASPDLK